ncbi:MAG: CotH kinase family protein [Bacteroidaceae bacterium]|nr:CotH kinase family protein [Bacteroidaceae bacterium]
MKKRFFISLVISLSACFMGGFPQHALAQTAIEDGVYYISCSREDGYLGLGAYHSVDPYIYYVTDGQKMTEDGYWLVTNTDQGCTIRNQASGQLLLFTYDRVDQYYKYMTLADDSHGDYSEYWNIIAGADGACCVQSALDTDYYWNLRAGTNMVGTYKGSNGTAVNERYTFHRTGDVPEPEPAADAMPTFPEALHVYLSDGRIEAYPQKFVTGYTEAGGKLTIATNIGETYTYDLAEVDSVSQTKPADLPTFDSFKFNNKFNDQLFTDALGEMVGDTVFVTLAAIGKRLTPSFQVADEGVQVYVDEVLQESKSSRLRFDKDIYYLISRKGYRILTAEPDNKYFMHPYGRYVRVHVDWLTDKAQVPTIYINTEDGKAITSKEYYKNAEITIDGHGIFPSMESTQVQIKGRGNSSWGWAKKPYRLKFATKVKPLGMTKGKSWVLLSNGQRGSLMSNAIGMKAANLMGASAANHIVPVDLYLNGEYRGSYNLTEKVGFSNNSVDLVDEDAAAMLELDSYYDEPEGQKFRSTPYNLPVNVKEPTFSEGTTRLTLDDISTSFNRFLSALYRSQDISRYVDVEQLVRFLMVNELTLNYEFYHPKSTFCYRESFESDTSKYIFGPVWDLDWCFGYERYRTYFSSEATSNYWIDMPAFEVRDFIRDLRFKYEPLDDLYRKLWKEFMDNDLQELMEFCQDYYDFAQNSFTQNSYIWGDYTDYGQQAQTAANWLQTRTKQVYDDIVSGKRPDIPDLVEPIEFANDRLYRITSRRGALVLTSDHKGLTVEQARFYDSTGIPEDDFLFAIIGIEGNNYLYSPVTKQYLAYNNNGTWVSMLGTPLVFDTSYADGEYLYMISAATDQGQTLYFNHNNSILVINGYTTPDPGNRWKIEEVGDFDPTEALRLASQSLYAVTNRYIYNGEVVGEETHQMPKGVIPPEPSERWANAFVDLIEPDDMPFSVTGDMTIDYTVDWHGPFSFSTSPEDASWYNMTIRTDYHVGKQRTEPYYPSVVDEETLIYDEGYYWAFGGNPYQVKVYNYTGGFDETLTPDGDNAVMRSGDFLWDLIPNRDGFVLRLPGTDYTCINQFGGSTGPLKFWTDPRSLTDDGSTFRLYEGLIDGIASHMETPEKGSAVYDLAGRRVEHPSHGLYIVNGRKIVIK